MLLVGLTGGIGSGKSTVSAMLAEHGAVIVDADEIAAQPAVARTRRCWRAMAERFGQHIIRDDGSLDRAAVAAIVFGDDPQARAALADLNGIVHPAMQDEIRRQIDAQSDDRSRRRARLPVADRESARRVWRRRIVVDIDPGGRRARDSSSSAG